MDKICWEQQPDTSPLAVDAAKAPAIPLLGLIMLWPDALHPGGGGCCEDPVLPPLGLRLLRSDESPSTIQQPLHAAPRGSSREAAGQLCLTAAEGDQTRSSSR